MTMIKALNVRVEEYTSVVDQFATPETDIREAAQMLEEAGYRHLPVMDSGKVVGLLSEREINIVMALLEDNLKVRVENIMVEDPYCAQKNSSLEQVVFDMSEKKIGSALILNDEGELYGIFTVTDALNALVEIMRGEILD